MDKNVYEVKRFDDGYRIRAQGPLGPGSFVFIYFNTVSGSSSIIYDFKSITFEQGMELKKCVGPNLYIQFILDHEENK